MHVAQQGDSLGMGRGSTDFLVVDDDIEHLSADAAGRVQGGHGLLEDHRRIAATNFQQVLFRGAEHVAVEHAQAAGGDAIAAFGQQAHAQHGGHRFARAGLADHTDNLAGVDVQRHAVQRLDAALVGRELKAQVVDGQYRLRMSHGHFPCCRGSSRSRTPSPSKLKPVAVIRIASPGKVEYHQLSRM